MKYKVGDKVRVRRDLIMGKRYYMNYSSVCDNCTSEMINLRGKVVTIEGVWGNGSKYAIRECGYGWTDEMFEGLYISQIDIEGLL